MYTSKTADMLAAAGIGRSLVAVAFSPLRLAVMHTLTGRKIQKLLELPPIPAPPYTRETWHRAIFAWPTPSAGAYPALRAWRIGAMCLAASVRGCPCPESRRC